MCGEATVVRRLTPLREERMEDAAVSAERKRTRELQRRMRSRRRPAPARAGAWRSRSHWGAPGPNGNNGLESGRAMYGPLGCRPICVPGCYPGGSGYLPLHGWLAPGGAEPQETLHPGGETRDSPVRNWSPPAEPLRKSTRVVPLPRLQFLSQELAPELAGDTRLHAPTHSRATA